jgi:hypothetical protein
LFYFSPSASIPNASSHSSFSLHFLICDKYFVSYIPLHNRSFLQKTVPSRTVGKALQQSDLGSFCDQRTSKSSTTFTP